MNFYRMLLMSDMIGTMLENGVVSMLMGQLM